MLLSNQRRKKVSQRHWKKIDFLKADSRAWQVLRGEAAFLFKLYCPLRLLKKILGVHHFYKTEYLIFKILKNL